jgi:hypothetical protein
MGDDGDGDEDEDGGIRLPHEKAGLVEQGYHVPRPLVMVMVMVVVMVMSSKKSRRTCVSLGFSARQFAIGQKKGIL